MAKNLANELSARLRVWRESPVQMVRDLFKVEPDAWQIDALEAFPIHPQQAFKAAKGCGKVQPKTMSLHTPDGNRMWGDVKVGDRVFAEDGTPTRVVEVFDNGVLPMFRVTFDDGSSSLAGADHLWKVMGANERRKASGWVVLTTAEIVARGVRVKNGRWAGRQFEIPRHGPVVMPHADLPLDPYILGVWLGDGTRGQPIYTKPDIEISVEIKRRGYSITRSHGGARVYVKECLPAIRDLPCFDRNSPDRFVPQDFKYGSIEQRRSLVCGLMDTDGTISRDGGMEFDSTSLRLAEDVVWLVRSLGGVAFIKSTLKQGWYRNEGGDRVNCRVCYRVTVRLPFNPFHIAKKAKRWRDPLRCSSTARYMTRYIDSIEPAGEADCMCVAIEHPSHCYLANDFIVTHNSTCLAWMSWNFLLTRPHAKIGAVSITRDNLADGLWAEMSKWQQKSPLLGKMFTWNKDRIFCNEAPSTWFMSAKSYARDANPEQQANTLAGFHADYVMFVLDEVGGMSDAVMVAAEAARSGCIECHIVAAGNPTHLSGPLYRAATVDRGKPWWVAEITGDPDNPKRSSRIPVEWAAEQIARYGRDNPFVMVNVLGQFPPSSLNALIGPDEVEQAMSRVYREENIRTAPRILGVDVAQFGDDASAIVLRRGLQAFKPRQERNLTSTDGAAVVAAEWNKTSADAVFIDASGGYGAGWIDRLRELSYAPIGVQFAGKATESERYFNKRAEMYLEMVEWIRDGGALWRSERLKESLVQTTYSFKGGRLLLEPKEQIKARLGFSPDEADALALTFAAPVASRILPRQRPSRHQVDYDPYADVNLGGAVAASMDYDQYR